MIYRSKEKIRKIKAYITLNENWSMVLQYLLPMSRSLTTHQVVLGRLIHELWRIELGHFKSQKALMEKKNKKIVKLWPLTPMFHDLKQQLEKQIMYK